MTGSTTNSQDRNHWPLWVRLALWGLPTRGVASVFFWSSLAVGVVCAIGTYWIEPLFIGVVCLYIALWYWAAIRWVDIFLKWPGKEHTP